MTVQVTAADLRAVAADMRAKAGAATPGPWTSHLADGLYEDAGAWIGAPGGLFVATTSNHTAGMDDGGHIAAWSPHVAVAVADLLDFVATAREQIDLVAGNASGVFTDMETCAAAVVRAWRGDVSEPTAGPQSHDTPKEER